MLFNLTTTLWDKNSYDLHFIGEETEAQRGSEISPGHTASKWWSRSMDPESITPDPQIFFSFKSASFSPALGAFFFHFPQHE